MNNFKQATKQGLRVNTTRGPLSVEQLWSLSMGELDTLAVSLEEAYENSKGKSFLSKKSSKDRTTKLMFDVVLEILESKVSDSERASKANETREHNQKILGLIAEKKEGELKDKSIEELEAMIK